MPPLTDDAVKMAVEVAKAGMPLGSGTMLTDPDRIAKFIEIVATKIHELKLNPNASKY